MSPRLHTPQSRAVLGRNAVSMLEVRYVLCIVSPSLSIPACSAQPFAVGCTSITVNARLECSSVSFVLICSEISALCWGESVQEWGSYSCFRVDPEQFQTGTDTDFCSSAKLPCWVCHLHTVPGCAGDAVVLQEIKAEFASLLLKLPSTQRFTNQLLASMLSTQ